MEVSLGHPSARDADRFIIGADRSLNRRVAGVQHGGNGSMLRMVTVAMYGVGSPFTSMPPWLTDPPRIFS